MNMMIMMMMMMSRIYDLSVSGFFDFIFKFYLLCIVKSTWFMSE
jgi:hypothetical protein